MAIRVRRDAEEHSTFPRRPPIQRLSEPSPVPVSRRSPTERRDRGLVGTSHTAQGLRQRRFAPMVGMGSARGLRHTARHGHKTPQSRPRARSACWRHTAASAEPSSRGAPTPPSEEELRPAPGRPVAARRYQPRLDMRPESLQELADSIRAQGVVQPIIVRPLAASPAGEPLATRSSPASVAGAPRRWRACATSRR